jgi:hypothetical protein
MQLEIFLDELLKACYAKETVSIYDEAALHLESEPDFFTQSRMWAHQLVRSKLATYCDEESTQLKITNYGRYWMARGGYLVFLKEEHELTEKRIQEKEAHQERLLEARLKLTKYRLLGFWVALVVSALGFVLSIFNLFLFLSQRQQ